MAITSRQHAIVKTFRRVARGDARLALLDGWHLLRDALAADVRVDTIAFTTRALTDDTEPIIAQARQRGASIVEVAVPVMEALSPVRTPTGVVGLVERLPASMPELFQPAPALIVLAIDMQDPGNVGAVIRAAEAGGATSVAFAGASADPWGWKALRAAMGSTFRLPVVTADEPAAMLNALRHGGVRTLATVPRGGAAMRESDLRTPVAFILGGEGAGLSQPLIDAADARISIPMQGRVESLNVAVAAALLVYEARRQRDVEVTR